MISACMVIVLSPKMTLQSENSCIYRGVGTISHQVRNSGVFRARHSRSTHRTETGANSAAGATAGAPRKRDAAPERNASPSTEGTGRHTPSPVSARPPDGADASSWVNSAERQQAEGPGHAVSLVRLPGHIRQQGGGGWRPDGRVSALDTVLSFLVHALQ